MREVATPTPKETLSNLTSPNIQPVVNLRCVPDSSDPSRTITFRRSIIFPAFSLLNLFPCKLAVCLSLANGFLPWCASFSHNIPVILTRFGPLAVLVPSGLKSVSFRIASSLLFAHLSSASSLFQRLFSSLTHSPTTIIHHNSERE